MFKYASRKSYVRVFNFSTFSHCSFLALSIIFLPKKKLHRMEIDPKKVNNQISANEPISRVINSRSDHFMADHLNDLTNRKK